MNSESATPRFLKLRVALLLGVAMSLLGCSGTSSSSDEPKRKQVEHPNPMGGPSRFTYE